MRVRMPADWQILGPGEVAAGLRSELRSEVGGEHPLFGVPVESVARRLSQDDVLFRLLDGSGKVADVHLTWSGSPETAPWPMAIFFDSFEDWLVAASEAR